MDRKSKLIFWIFFVSAAFVLTALFSKFYILRDYMLQSEVECDPQTETCFERPCLEECKPDASPEYYKIRTVQASDVPVCDPHVEKCPDVNCAAIESCSEEYCNDENVPEGESCTRPEDFSVSDPEGESLDGTGEQSGGGAESELTETAE